MGQIRIAVHKMDTLRTEILFLVGTVFLIELKGEPLSCYVCNINGTTTNPINCHTLQKCETESQVCIVSETVTDVLEFKYRLGCIEKKYCPHREVVPGRRSLGLKIRRELRWQCCESDGCNRRLPGNIASCERNWIKHGSYCYYFSHARFNKHDADRIACYPSASSLLDINDADENSFIADHLARRGPFEMFWLGMTHTNNTVIWTSTQKPVVYQNWKSSQRFSAHDQCALIDRHGLWYTTSCGRTHPFVCKKRI